MLKSEIKLKHFYNKIVDKIIDIPELFPEIFNLCLIYNNNRPCMLLETANYYRFNSKYGIDIIEYFLGIIPKDIFRIVSDDFRFPRYFIFKNVKFTNISDNTFKIGNISDEVIGNILGFNCPGHMTGLWSITYFINNYHFYTEKCDNYDLIRDKQQSQFLSFKKSAEILGLEFKEKIKKNLSIDEIISAIMKSNIEIIIKNKDIIGSLYYDIGLNHIGQNIFNENLNKEMLENMKNYIEKIQYFLDSICGISK